MHESIAILSIAVSLVGFLEASAKNTVFWTAREKLQIVDHMRAMLSRVVHDCNRDGFLHHPEHEFR